MTDFIGYVIIPESLLHQAGGRSSIGGFKGKYASEDRHCLIWNETLIAYVRADGKECYLGTKGIKKIGKYAFKGVYRYAMCFVRLSEGIEEIADYAFYWHINDFNGIELPGSLKKIGRSVFNDCLHVQYICCQATVPPAVDGDFDFYYSDKIKAIYVPEPSVELYKEADGWSEHASKIEGYTWHSEESSPLFTVDLWPY